MMQSIIYLPYGNRGFELQVPEANLMGVVKPRKAITNSAKSDADVIRHALTNPIGTRRLDEIVKPGQKVAIITSDISRPCPSEILLPYILETMNTAGVADEHITVVLALGLHRKMTTTEIDLALSPEIRQRVRVINHNKDDTIFLGRTSRGTPVEIFRTVVEADVRVCLGNLEFHYFAGYSGGAKAILPGCASQASVTANHAMMVKPEATSGNADGNPLREDLEEGAAMLGVDFILNVIVDDKHRVIDAVAGDMIKAHRAGCELIARRGKVWMPSKSDIVVASSGGFPKDIDFYQAHKGLENANNFVRDGGVIILTAECRDGLGNKVLEDWMLTTNSPREIISRLQADFVLGGHKAAAIAAIVSRTNVYIVSSLEDQLVEQLFMTPFESPQAGLDAAFTKLGSSSKVLVLPESGSVIPNFGY